MINVSTSRWDERFGFDQEREVIRRTHNGTLELVDSCSDDAEIIDEIRNHRPEMRFRLTYDGSLKSAGNSNRPKEKWEIRKHIQPQLAELWQIHPALLGYAFAYRLPETKGEWPKNKGHERNRIALLEPITVGSKQFLPLVRSSLFLACSLDILFLRKDGPGSVVTGGGDLDNRLKTLFDGLKMPTQKSEVDAGGELNADPFQCLLEDDKLVSSLTIRTDRLLTSPGGSADQVRLIIDVIVSPTRIDIASNSGFVGD